MNFQILEKCKTRGRGGERIFDRENTSETNSDSPRVCMMYGCMLLQKSCETTNTNVTIDFPCWLAEFEQ